MDKAKETGPLPRRADRRAGVRLPRRVSIGLLLVALMGSVLTSAPAGGAPPAGSVVVDGFDRADATTLGSTETGQAWATWQGAARVLGRQAYLAGTAYTVAVVNSTTARGATSLTVVTPSAEFWMIVRASDPGNYWRFGRWQGGPYLLQQIRNSALGSPVITPGATLTPATGDRLSCQMGAGLSCSVNGTAVATTADTFNSTATSMGLSGGAGAPTRFDDMLVTTPPPAPDLGIAVTAASSPVATGAPVSWTATVTNTGDRAATAAVVTISVPAGVTGTTVTSKAGTCSSVGGSWTCAIGKRTVGSIATVTINGTAPAANATLTLTASVAAAEADADSTDNSASTSISARVPPPAGAVVVDGFDRPDAATLGSPEIGPPWVTWQGVARVAGGRGEVTGTDHTVAVVNSTTARGATSLTVTTPSAEFWLVVRAADSGNYWRFGRWQSGPYLLQQIRSSSLGSPAISAMATVTPAAGDRLSCQMGAAMSCSVNGTTVATTSDSFNATATFMGFSAGTGVPTRFDDLLVTTPPPAPDLGVAVTTASSSVGTGAPVSWTATVANTGTRAATAATLAVAVPAGVTGVTVTSTAGTCSPSAGTWTCALGNRAVGSTVTVTVNATAPATNATLTLTASAASTEADADPTNNSASLTISARVPPPPGAVVVDGFDRPDAATLGSPEIGQPWVTWQGVARVAAGRGEVTGTEHTVAVVNSTTARGATSLTVTTPSAEFWMIVRGSDTGNYWRFGRWQGGPYLLQQIRSSALGSPAITAGATITPAADDRLSCQMGAGLSCSVNGTTVATTADTFNSTASFMGLSAGAGAPARFDEMLVTTPPPAPDLGVSVTAASSSVAAGTPVSWTVGVTNTGNRVATAATVTVSVPAGVSGAGVSSTSGTCSPSAGTWSCAIGDRATGSTATVTVSGTAPATSAILTLTASAAATEADGDPTNNSASASISSRVAPPPGSLVVDGFDRPDALALGSTETGQAWATWQGVARVAGGLAEVTGSDHTVAVVNSTTAGGATSLTVAAPSPEFWMIVRASANGNYWRFGRWQGGPYLLQQIRSSALGSPVITAGATLTPAAGDRLSCQMGTSSLSCSVNGTLVASTADSFNATATYMGFSAGAGAPARFDEMLVTPPAPAPDLGVAVTAANSSVPAGAPVSWTVTVTNTGTRTATATVVSVSVPAGVAGATVTSAAGSCTNPAGTWSCTIGNRAVGSSTTVAVSGTAPAANATLSLSASASATEADADPTNNTAGAAIASRVPPPPGSVVVDVFDRPDAATLGSTETGQDWATWQGGFGVSNGAAVPTGAGQNMVTLDPGWSFGTFEVTIAAGATEPFSVILRGASTANHFRIGRDASGYYRMWKVVNGVVRDMQFLIVRENLAPRNGDVIRINNRPDDGIYVAVNGRHVLDGGDVDLLTSFRFGFAASSPTVRFDSLWISQTISSGTTTVEGFSDSNGVELNQADAGTLYPWRMANGYWVTRSGRATLESPGYGVAWMDMTSELGNAKVTALDASREAWLLFRYSEDGSYLRFGRYGGDLYALERVVNGDAVTVGPATTRSAVAGDVIEVRQDVNGRIDCLVNGAIAATTTDSSFNARATAYGIAGEQGAQFDDLTVTGK